MMPRTLPGFSGMSTSTPVNRSISLMRNALSNVPSTMRCAISPTGALSSNSSLGNTTALAWLSAIFSATSTGDPCASDAASMTSSSRDCTASPGATGGLPRLTDPITARSGPPGWGLALDDRAAAGQLAEQLAGVVVVLDLRQAQIGVDLCDGHAEHLDRLARGRGALVLTFELAPVAPLEGDRRRAGEDLEDLPEEPGREGGVKD